MMRKRGGGAGVEQFDEQQGQQGDGGEGVEVGGEGRHCRLTSEPSG